MGQFIYINKLQQFPNILTLYFQQLDMIDKALGIEAPSRRRRPDNASEGFVVAQLRSSKNDSALINQSTPSKPALKKLYNQEPTQSRENPSPAGEPTAKPKSKRQQAKPVESQQQIASPAVKTLGISKLPIKTDHMKNSMKESSSRFIEQQNAAQKQASEQFSYKIKMVIFLVISLLLMLHAMTPDRKVSGRRK